MEFSFTKDQHENPSVCVSHNGQDLFFYSGELKIQLNDAMFEPINRFVSTQSLNIQDELFAVYKSFREYLDEHRLSDRNVSSHEEQISQFFYDIYRIIPMPVFFQYMQWKEVVVLPANVHEHVVYDQDGERTEDKTYLARDYKNLVYLITYLRLATPIIAELNHIYKNKVGLINLKIWYLMYRTPIVENEIIDKLVTYIRSNIFNKNDKSVLQTDGIVLDLALSDDTLETLIVSHVMLWKPFPTDYTSAHSNIVSTIYNIIKYLNNSIQEKPGELNSKTHVGDPKKEDMSYFEDYRKTTDVPLGVSVEIEFFLKDHRSLVDNLCLGMYYNEHRFHETRRALAEHLSKHPNPIQFKLLGWFLNRYINHRAVRHLSKSTIITNMALMSSLMWEAGEHFISLLMTSNSVREDHPSTMFTKTTLSSKNREDLATKFSYYSKNDILESSICSLAKEITHYKWKPIMPEQMIDGYGGRKQVSIPTDLTTVLTNFLVRFT